MEQFLKFFLVFVLTAFIGGVLKDWMTRGHQWKYKQCYNERYVGNPVTAECEEMLRKYFYPQ